MNEIGITARRWEKTERAMGTFLPVFALPGRRGIGTLGEAAVRFLDFLSQSGQRYWQLLPIGTTAEGDSPYKSYCVEAGNPYLIDPDELLRDGLLRTEDLETITWPQETEQVDYDFVRTTWPGLLERAWTRFQNGARPDLREAFAQFCVEQRAWLDDFALFMSLKERYKGAEWADWPEALRFRESGALEEARSYGQARISWWSFVQFLFFRQWGELRQAARERGIRIFGDMPIYVPYDSVEVWKEPGLFLLDEQLHQTFLAGVPPDYFSADGQLWGSALYDWPAMAAEGYAWWIRKLRCLFDLYDLLRVDHFRALESFWAVPHGEKTARKGVWKPGPGIAFFQALEAAAERGDLGENARDGLPLAAEDLGFLTPELCQFREASGLPGMNVLLFAFTPAMDSIYLPHRLRPHSLIYPGTHDCQTIMGWFASAPEEITWLARTYLGLNEAEGFNWGMIRAAMTSVSKLCVVQMQDFLGCGNEARINRPGVARGNWRWRLREGALTPALAARIRDLVRLSGRLEGC